MIQKTITRITRTTMMPTIIKHAQTWFMSTSQHTYLLSPVATRSIPLIPTTYQLSAIVLDPISRLLCFDDATTCLCFDLCASFAPPSHGFTLCAAPILPTAFGVRISLLKEYKLHKISWVFKKPFAILRKELNLLYFLSYIISEDSLISNSFDVFGSGLHPKHSRTKSYSVLQHDFYYFDLFYSYFISLFVAITRSVALGWPISIFEEHLIASPFSLLLLYLSPFSIE